MTYWTDPASHAGIFDSGTTNWIPSSPRARATDSLCPALMVAKITGNLLALFGKGPAGRYEPSVANWQTIYKSALGLSEPGTELGHGDRPLPDMGADDRAEPGDTDALFGNRGRREAPRTRRGRWRPRARRRCAPAPAGSGLGGDVLERAERRPRP